MKRTFLYLLIILLISCNTTQEKKGSNSNTQPQVEASAEKAVENTVKKVEDAVERLEDTDQKELKDSLSKYTSDKLIALRKEMYSQYKNRKEDWLAIYLSFSYENKKGNLINLVPLTDTYPWSKHKDSLVIDNRYLIDITDEDENYHELNQTYRSRFLQRMNISEKHKIFVYNTSRDTIFTYNVQDQPIVGVLSPYERQKPFRQEDYIIGFDLNKIQKGQINRYESVLVYIGEENPFQTGYLKSIRWSKIDYSFFDSYTDNQDVINIDKSLISEIYHFTTDDFDYFMFDIGAKQNNHIRRLVVYSKKSKAMITDLLYNEGEGRSYTRMAIEGEKKNFATAQVTGKLFKNKPPVIFGFLSHSFGCSKIDFLDKERSFIRLRCDNRH